MKKKILISNEINKVVNSSPIFPLEFKPINLPFIKKYDSYIYIGNLTVIYYKKNIFIFFIGIL